MVPELPEKTNYMKNWELQVLEQPPKDEKKEYQKNC